MEGNTALSAEVLEQIFLHLSYEDLASLLLVCRFWASVAERPKLWQEFRLQVYQPGSVLGLARFLCLKSASVSSDSEAVGRAVVGHPTLQEVTLRHIPRPAKRQKHSYRKLLHFAMHFAMDQYHTAPGCSRIQVLKISQVFIQCGQLAELLTAVTEMQTSLHTLGLSRLGSSCPHGHTSCPLPPLLLGQAANCLTRLTLDNLGFTCSLTGEQMEEFFKALQNDTKLKELILSSIPAFVTVNPHVLTEGLRKVKKLVLSTVNLSLEQANSLFCAIKTGTTKLKELSIYFKPINTYNELKNLEASILAGALNMLERVVFENVNLNSHQVSEVLKLSLKKTQLQELKLDRYDADRSHLFLDPIVLDNISFSFEFRQ